MRQCLIAAVVSAVVMSGAQAEQADLISEASAAAPNLSERLGDDAPVSPLAFLRLKSVNDQGEIIGPGDLVQIKRDFGNWTLRCDVRLTKNRRTCFVEQRISNTMSSLVWRIGMNIDDKPIVQFSLPASINIDSGLRMKFSGLEKTLDQSHFACSANACTGGFLFQGFIQSAISDSMDIGFSYTAKSGETINLDMSMSGFALALEAAGRDPFGRDISEKVARDELSKAKSASSQKPSAKSSPEKRIATPKKQSSERPSQPVSSPAQVSSNEPAKKNTLY